MWKATPSVAQTLLQSSRHCKITHPRGDFQLSGLIAMAPCDSRRRERCAGYCMRAWLCFLSAALVFAQGREGGVIRADPGLDEIVPTSAKIEKLAGNFVFTEGPVWIHEGYLLFSDIPKNVIEKWMPAGGVSVFRNHSGYNGADKPAGAYIGSNGLTLDAQGRVTICET